MKGIIPTSTRRKKRRVARSIHIIEPVQTKNLKNKVVLESDLDQLKLGEKKSQFFSKRLSSRRIEENSDGMINAISSLSIKNLVSGNSLNTNRWLKRSNNHNEIVKQVKASFMSLCPSTSISHLTSTYNERISNEWNKLNIESDSKINKIAGIKTDWRDLLKTASKEIKRASYQLSTLVTDGEQHVQLFNGSLQDLELLDSFPKYCKIFWK